MISAGIRVDVAEIKTARWANNRRGWVVVMPGSCAEVLAFERDYWGRGLNQACSHYGLRCSTRAIRFNLCAVIAGMRHEEAPLSAAWKT